MEQAIRRKMLPRLEVYFSTVYDKHQDTLYHSDLAFLVRIPE
jgi:hypothetical protein